MHSVEIRNTNWFLSVSRNNSFFNGCIYTYQNYWGNLEYGIDAHLAVMVYTENGNNSYAFVCQPNYDNYCKEVIKSVSTYSDFEKLKNKYHVFADELELATQELLQHSTVDNWTQFLKHYARFSTGLNITTTIGRLGNEILQSAMANFGLSDSDILKLTPIITYPEEKTPFYNANLDLLKILHLQQTTNFPDSELEIHFEQWLSRYQHIPVNFIDEPWKISDVWEMYKKISHLNSHQEMAEMARKQQEILDERYTGLSKINSEQVHYWSRILAECTSLNEFRKNHFSKISFMLRPFYLDILKTLGSKNLGDQFFLKPSEITDILQGKTIDLQDIKRTRKNLAYMVDTEGKQEILSDQERDKIANFIQNPDQNLETKTHNISGKIGNKGKIIGKVCLVLSSQDFEKFCSGDVLVAPMTSVNYLPVMNMASAFVTDEGGVISHASIVAREMNKPCIIGTKIATKVLKDGDLVEVDADNGVVKIIQKIS